MKEMVGLPDRIVAVQISSSKVSAFHRMIPVVAAAGLLTLGAAVAPAMALAEPGSGSGTGGSAAGGSGFTVDHGTITSNDTPQEQKAPVYYPNCAAVRAAGKAPLYGGQPGYSLMLDPKGTGVACAPGTP